MTKKLLIAVDASKESIPVLKQGRELSILLDADYSILTVVEPLRFVYINEGDLAGRFIPSIEDMKDHVKRSLLEMTKSTSIPPEKIMVEEGKVVDTILSIAEENAFDLIIVGSHGKSGLKLLLGSTANGVLHHAKCNVLAVRVYED